jgi:hypothetical protein
VRTLADAIEKRILDPKQMASRTDIADGLQRLALRLNGEKFQTPPPAAAPSTPNDMTTLGPAITVSRLWLAAPEPLPVPPERQSLQLVIVAGNKTQTVELTRNPAPINLLIDDGAMLTVWVSTYEPRSFFSASKLEPWTKAARIAANEIRTRGPIPITLAGERPLRSGGPVESVKLELGIRTDRFEPGAASVKGTVLRAEMGDGVAVYEATPGADDVWMEQVIVPATGSKSYALVWRDRRGKGGGAAEARRTDGGPPIGIVAPDLPLLAAAADGWGSLAIVLANNPRRERARFVVLAATGDSGAAEALFLAFAANHLGKLTVDGAPLSASEAARALVWARMALGLPTQLDPSVLERLPPDVAATLRRALARGAAR